MVMAAGLSFILIYNLRNLGFLYVPTPDGNLYLSVADNFWKTGHFIQSARPYEKGMIVPFGFPAILVVLKLAFRDSGGIVFMQYLIFVSTGILINRVIMKLFKENIKQPQLAAWGVLLVQPDPFYIGLIKIFFRELTPQIF